MLPLICDAFLAIFCVSMSCNSFELSYLLSLQSNCITINLWRSLSNFASFQNMFVATHLLCEIIFQFQVLFTCIYKLFCINISFQVVKY